jgi:Fe-S cluster assembly protein SufD
MNDVTGSAHRYLAEFAQAGKSLPGSRLPWVQHIREEALARFMTLGFPSTRLEDWKYTSLSALEKRSYPMASAVHDWTSEVVFAWAFPMDCHLLFFVNGHYLPEFSKIAALPEAVHVGSLAQGLNQQPEKVRHHLGRHADYGRHALVALNTAFWADGAYIDLPAGCVLDKPIHVLFLATGEAAAAHPRNLIIVGPKAQARVVEHYAGAGNAEYFNNAVTEIVLEEGAQLEHCKLQQEAVKSSHITTLQVAQKRSSKFVSHSISLGAALARHDINVDLQEDTVCTMNGLYVVGGRQHVDHHTCIDHSKPRGTSREFYKGVLDGRSRGVFNGKVVVYPDAQLTDAQQSNKNLLLSVDAEVDTKPQLEIFADDVKCAHGATVGQLDEQMLFYLRSRGIEEAAARSLLTYAFADEVLKHISMAAVRSRLEEILINRLPDGQRIREFL